MSRLAIITFITPQGVDIDNTLPGAPVYPGQGLPGWSGPVDPGYGRPGWGAGHPDQGLPGGGGHPSHPIQLPPPGQAVTLPVFPFDPTAPDQGLPDVPQGPPVQIRPGAKFVVKWLACTGLILVPDQGLPEPPEATPKA